MKKKKQEQRRRLIGCYQLHWGFGFKDQNVVKLGRYIGKKAGESKTASKKKRLWMEVMKGLLGVFHEEVFEEIVVEVVGVQWTFFTSLFLMFGMPYQTSHCNGLSAESAHLL